MVSQLERVGNILGYLAEHDNSTRYALLKKAGRIGGKTTFYRTMKQLTSLGLIEIKPESPSGRQCYRITQNGLVLYLRICAQIGKQNLKTTVDFRNFAKAHPKLLQNTFAHWSDFAEHRIADIMEKMLIRLAFWAADPEYNRGMLIGYFLKDFERRKLHSPDGRTPLADVLETGFFNLDNPAYVTLEKEDRGRLFQALRADADMRKPFVEQMKLANSVEQSRIMTRKMMIEYLEMNPRSDKRMAEFDRWYREIQARKSNWYFKRSFKSPKAD